MAKVFKGVSGTFGATGVSASRQFKGDFNFKLTGVFVGTVAVERRMRIQVDDDGQANPTWSAWGAVDTFTAPVERGGYESEPNVEYRVNCTAWTSGTPAYRLSCP